MSTTKDRLRLKWHNELKTLDDKRDWWKAHSPADRDLMSHTMFLDLMEAYEKLDFFKSTMRQLRRSIKFLEEN